VGNDLKVWGMDLILQELFINALSNSIKNSGKSDINFLVNIRADNEEDVDGAFKPVLVITIADTAGGAFPDPDRLIALNGCSQTGVESETGGLGQFLTIARDIWRAIGQFHGIKCPIYFSNTEAAGKKGFTITAKLRVVE
jgi:hypothetical protein